MKMTSVYLDPQLVSAIDRLAASQGITKAEAIRRALRRATEDLTQPPVTAIGVGEGTGDVAREVDRHLSESGFGR